MNEWIVNCEQRLLTFLRDRLHKSWSTKDLRWSIEHQRCFVNGRVERFCSCRIHKGDRLLFFPTKHPLFIKEKERILYEDQELLFYNKPPFIDTPTLAKILGTHLVHRLDRDTTGLLVFAKNLHTQKQLEALFRNRQVKKEYVARVEGRPSGSGSVSGDMAPAFRRQGAVQWKMVSNGQGIWSQTKWKVENGYIVCLPLTGRTHQIRLHMQAIGFPIIGDPVYGSKHYIEGVYRPLLHAHKISLLSHTIQAPLPDDMMR